MDIFRPTGARSQDDICLAPTFNNQIQFGFSPLDAIFAFGIKLATMVLHPVRGLLAWDEHKVFIPAAVQTVLRIANHAIVRIGEIRYVFPGAVLLNQRSG